MTEHTRHILANLSPREWLRSMMLGFPVPDHARAPRRERRTKGRRVA